MSMLLILFFTQFLNLTTQYLYFEKQGILVGGIPRMILIKWTAVLTIPGKDTGDEKDKINIQSRPKIGMNHIPYIGPQSA
jgi:hypothetical protein